MKVRLMKPEPVDRSPDGQGGPSGRRLTTWRGEFDGYPDRRWLEAFSMWAEHGQEGLQDACGLRATTSGYEFDCGEDEIDDIVDKLAIAAERAGIEHELNRAKDTDHRDTRVLFGKVDELLAQAKADEQEAEQRKLEGRTAKKSRGPEQ